MNKFSKTVIVGFCTVSVFALGAAYAQEAETPAPVAGKAAEAVADVVEATEAAAGQATEAVEAVAAEVTQAVGAVAPATEPAASETPVIQPAIQRSRPQIARTPIIAIMNGEVHTVTGGVIENGDVILRDGRIAAVGADLQAPNGAQIIDARGKVVTPGLIAPYSSIGLVEISLDHEANDASTRDEGFPLGASLDARDAFNPSSSLIAINRAGGITRALSAPTPGEFLFGGQAAFVDLSGRVMSVNRGAVAQNVAMGYAGARRAGDTRMGSWALLREYLDQAKAYQRNPAAFEARARNGRFAQSDLRALGEVVSGRQPMILSINGVVDLRNLIRLKSDYGIKVIARGGSEAWRVADDLARAEIPVILDPMFNLPSQFEDLGATLKSAAILHDAGVAISLHSDGVAGGSHNLRLLPQLAGNAVAHGLPHEAALEALTLAPATFYGLEGQLGSLETGKIADVVIWDGDPFEVSTRPTAVIIAGRNTSLENRQTMLRDRYRDLTRGELPMAYRGGE